MLTSERSVVMARYGSLPKFAEAVGCWRLYESPGKVHTVMNEYEDYTLVTGLYATNLKLVWRREPAKSKDAPAMAQPPRTPPARSAPSGGDGPPHELQAQAAADLAASAQPSARPSSSPDNTAQEMLVRAALRELQEDSLLNRADQWEKWFPTAFNDWYGSATRRGYVGGMAPVFDIGVTLLEPTADAHSTAGHGALLRWLRERPMVGELARRAVPATAAGAHNSDIRGLVTWTMIEPLLRCLNGVWDSRAIARQAATELPTVERRLDGYHIFSGAYATQPFAVIKLGPEATTGGGGSGRARAAAAASVTSVSAPSIQSLAERLFSAQIAGLAPELAHKLDHELVDACLLGPSLAPRNHEPPRRWPSEVATTRQSKQPGTIAGVTRVETKQPTDPVTDILPSELMLARRSRRAGLFHILNGKPLVFVHEREWDIIPKHRALVCYIVDAHQDMLESRSAAGTDPRNVRRYRDHYVYAKRQVIDTLHDLADAQALARHNAEVQIEAAVFALPPGRDHAVVHQRMTLEGLGRTAGGDPTIDRLAEMGAMAERMPRFFIRYAPEQDRRPAPVPRRVNDTLPPDVARFLREAMQHGRYRVIHLVLIGVAGESRLLERLYRYLHYQSATPVRIVLIGLHLNANDSDARLGNLREPAWTEPAWTYAEAGSLRDALVLDAGRHEVTALAKLRPRLVESIFGKEVEASAAQLSRIRIA